MLIYVNNFWTYLTDYYTILEKKDFIDIWSILCTCVGVTIHNNEYIQISFRKMAEIMQQRVCDSAILTIYWFASYVFYIQTAKSFHC